MVARRRTILIVHSDAVRRAALVRLLGPELDLVVAATRDQGLRLLADTRVDAIVADAGLGESLLEDAERLAPSAPRILLTRAAEIEPLIERMGAGHSFVTLADDGADAQLLERLAQLLHPRRSGRFHLESSLMVRFLDEGVAAAAYAVVDISNRGLAFHVEPGQGLDVLLPGRRLGQVTVSRGNQVVLGGVDAIVRHLGAEARGYRVGIKFLAAPSRDPGDSGDSIEDLLQKTALVREALAREGIVLCPADDPDDAAVFRVGQVVPMRGLIVLAGRLPDGSRPGDVLRGTFDLAGTSYAFLSSVAGPEESWKLSSELAARDLVLLWLPRAIKPFRRRICHRYHPPANGPIDVEISAPFDEELIIRRSVLDINSSGLAFPIESGQDAFPVGTVLRNVTLRLPDSGRLSVRGRVRSLTPLPASQGRALKCGVELEGMTSSSRTRIADAIVSSGMPGVASAEGLSFEALWAFLKETRFLYPEKEESLRLELPAIRHTMAALLAQRGDVFKTLVFHRSDRLRGHVSIGRIYDHTWIVQHLATLKGGDGWLAAARLLNLGLMEFLDQTPEMEWLKTYFRPQNAWPSRVFGGFASRLGDPDLSDMRTLSYLTASTDGLLDADVPGVSVRPAVAGDACLVERHFVATGRTVALRSDDLCEARLDLERVSAAYRSIGLERRREILVAERAGDVVGFALLQVSSVGLNLSELTNAFTPHVLGPDPGAVQALAWHARKRYRELGYGRCIGLTEDADLAPFEAAGFYKRREYCCWTWHRSLYRRYYEHVRRLYRRTARSARDSSNSARAA